jgi:enoyl-[acyl-carrier protein] reductase I
MGIMAGKRGLVTGVLHETSIATSITQSLLREGAECIFTHMPGEKMERRTRKIAEGFGIANPWLQPMDVGQDADITACFERIGRDFGQIDFFVHSIAFANYSEGFKAFHETKRADFLQATAISAFSLVEIAQAFKPLLANNASVVTIGISSLLVTPDNYGYMGPIKAALDSCARFLAKSFSAETEVRFNVIGAGPLKTSASAGIPGYLESYLYAEKLTFRRRNLSTQEVADTALFLLSNRSSGINGASLVVDAGLGSNFFDKEIIRLAMRMES